MSEEVKRLKGLGQPPLNTTRLGVLKGASDYYGLGHSGADLYGENAIDGLRKIKMMREGKLQKRTGKS